ncbi:MAG: ATP-dependent helicase UvrD/PcrA [Thermotogota bacterium]|nr:ATP-dependent helicase UvrD/PcrA [Thermotogota bacterium]MDK2865143.1 ATP-dependent helicase UvrD/PcrA [Thermotogota bacterium]HCZ06788.1 ATP-dependent helicase [Thermotogota bacterium]
MNQKHYVLKASKFEDAISQYLDEEQYRAVVESSGRSIVVAGPGSGKTRVITYKIAHLVRNGLSPSRILLVTFTRAAAREMTERAKMVCSSNLEGMLSGTFHHVCNVLLRRYSRKLGYDPNFTILDPDDARQLLDMARSEVVEGMDTNRKRMFPRASVLASIISYASNTLTDLADAIFKYNPRFLEFQPEIESIWEKYVELKKSNNAMDYDDLLINALHLLETDKDIRERESQKYSWILVDEFQDTNIVQYKIVELLSSTHGNLMVVGDDSQSIYSFRGARFENVFDFLKKEGTRLFKIQTNYRSTPPIVEFINSIEPKSSIPKKLVSARRGGTKPKIVTTWDRLEEAQFVAQKISELIESGVPAGEIAVLYRAHAHSLELQMQLDQLRIPYRLLSGPRFTETAHVKDVISLLRLLENPKDLLATIRFMKLFPGIGSKYATRIANEIANRAVTGKEIPEVLKTIQISRVDLDSIKKLIAEVHHLSSPAEVIEIFLSEFYSDYLEATYPDARSRKQDIERLIEIASRYSSIENFLSEISVAERVDVEAQERERTEEVVLSTVHQAKGLEWRVVFVISLNPGDFPSGLSIAEGNLDEEERIFYVAVTRAKDDLFLVRQKAGRHSPFSSNRLVIRRGEDFLTNIPQDVVERWEVRWE